MRQKIGQAPNKQDNKMKIFYIATDSDNAQDCLKQLKKDYPASSLEEAEIIIALGGDGTMLEALHHDNPNNLPIYGMNCGSIGFLMNPFRAEDLAKRLDEAHDIEINPLKMVVTDMDGKQHEALAFNEVSLLRQTRQAAKINIKIDDVERLPELVCDGILLSTPAGSTAYNLSAHGPIIPLSAHMLALTPISAFRPRRWRGALVPWQHQVTLSIINSNKRPVSATADSTEIRNVESVTICKSDETSRTLLFDPDNNLEERILKEQFEV